MNTDNQSYPVSVTVIIPTYKEEKRLPKTLQEFHPYLTDHFKKFEIIIVDDNSPDQTRTIIFSTDTNIAPEIMRNIRVINQGERYGKGAAIRRGFEESTCDIVMFLDADHSSRIDNLSQCIPQIIYNNIEAIVGNRINVEKTPLIRGFISSFLKTSLNLIFFEKNIKDSQCGFKVFNKNLAKKLADYCRTNNGMIDVEIFSLLHKWDSTYEYIDIEWRNDPDSRINLLRVIPRDIKELIAIYARLIKHTYNNPVTQCEKIWNNKK